VRLAVVVPVKGRDYKTRLSGRMGPQDREELSKLLLIDLLGVVAEARLLGHTFVVSSSTGMLGVARRCGAQGVREERDLGVTAAVALAVRKLPAYDDFLVLPSDLPLLIPSDVAGATRLRRRGMAVVISPSVTFNGTNLLLFSRARSIDLSYDDDSFWNHVGSAAAKRLPTAVYVKRGISTDVDTEEDVSAVLGTHLNRRSVAFLRRFAPWPESS